MLSNVVVRTSAAARISSSSRIGASSRCRWWSSAVQPEEEEEESSSDTTILDSFRVLGVPRKFGLSDHELKQSYRRLMTEFHPDKHTNKSLPERERVDDIASQVTNAFQILRQPHTRATHLLELLGTPMEETSKSDLVGTAFLMEVMELTEAVDSTAPLNLKPIWDETQHHIKQVVEDVETAFDEKDFAKAMELSAQLQYWHRIETAIHEKMEEE